MSETSHGIHFPKYSSRQALLIDAAHDRLEMAVPKQVTKFGPAPRPVELSPAAESPVIPQQTRSQRRIARILGRQRLIEAAAQQELVTNLSYVCLRYTAEDDPSGLFLFHETTTEGDEPAQTRRLILQRNVLAAPDDGAEQTSMYEVLWERDLLEPVAPIYVALLEAEINDRNEFYKR